MIHKTLEQKKVAKLKGMIEAKLKAN